MQNLRKKGSARKGKNTVIKQETPGMNFGICRGNILCVEINHIFIKQEIFKETVNV